jgi:hypothetical protein
LGRPVIILSAYGTKQTYEVEPDWSAQERIADVPRANVCLGVENGNTGRFSHSLLMTHSGHVAFRNVHREIIA